MKDYSLLNLITLANTFGAGSSNGFKVFEKINSSGLLNAEIKNIATKIEFSDTVKSKLISAKYDRAEKIIETCKEHKINILKITDSIYPDSLKNISIPPLVLYYKGIFPDFNTLPSITIVGPRKCTDYGKKAAFSLGYRLSRAGMIVVSGGAKGCDAAAHKGVLSAEGITALLLGCGILCNYLPENKPLREEVAKSGCLISEYPPLARPSRISFPIRNRIMSGLTLGTVVVEGREGSGAIITAKAAAEEGRDVFVIPGNPSVNEYKGSNNLLREGAKPLLDCSDIFGEYLPSYPEYLDIERAYSKKDGIKTKKEIKKYEKNLKETLSNEAKIVYNYLDKQIFSIDDLSATNLSSDLILSALTELELENLIEPVVGGQYKIK